MAAQNTASFERSTDVTSFIELEISMSQENIYIDRAFGKVDDRLSYIGGLFELVIIFLSFFIASYNVYRYELIVS